MLATKAVSPATKRTRQETALVVGGCEEIRGAVEDFGLRLHCAADEAEAAATMRVSTVDIVIAEASLADGAGLDFCRLLRADPRTELVPVLLVAAGGGVGMEIAAMGCGADALLMRPFHPAALRMRLRSMLRRKAAVDRREDSEAVLLALARAVEQRDNVTAGHGDRLAAIGVAMGIALGLGGDQLLALHRGGYLHDIGKIGLPDSILFKTAPLTADEWALMRTHTVRGEEICRPIRTLAPVLPIVRSHHEHWDGSGYPDGLAGHEIPLLARVMQLADVYDALTSERSYKQAMSPADALLLMREEEARGWYDPDLMRVFLRLRHEELRGACARYSAEWRDASAMRESLENLRDAILGV
jgi:putative two-component system response regulator